MEIFDANIRKPAKTPELPCILPDKQGTLRTRSKMHSQSLLRARPFRKALLTKCLFCWSVFLPLVGVKGLVISILVLETF